VFVANLPGGTLAQLRVRMRVALTRALALVRIVGPRELEGLQARSAALREVDEDVRGTSRKRLAPSAANGAGASIVDWGCELFAICALARSGRFWLRHARRRRDPRDRPGRRRSH